MDIRSVDLNLLVVFDAMVRHGSVTRAAEALALSQPATSAAVGRLRTLFGDPLFVKIGAQMRPTPRATELSRPVRTVVDTIQADILRLSAFEPQRTQRVFTLLAPDIAEIKLLPKILDRFTREAPQASLRTLAMPRHAAAEGLETGLAELAVGYFPDLKTAGFYQQKLFSNRLVCIVRRDHPTIGESLTPAEYFAAAHAVVRPDGREHVFEEFLQKQGGGTRRVLLEISHFLSLMPIIAGSDLVATVPEDLAEVCVRHAAIRTLPLPVESPVIEVHQSWHRRFHKDPAHVWLRGLIHATFSG